MKRHIIPTVVTVTLLIGTLALADPAAYVVVDTGQTQCYNDTAEITAPGVSQPFYGQDAQHAGVQPRYTISSDGLTVYDENTGLTWQRSPDADRDRDIDAKDKFTWSQAQAYPTTLNRKKFGGYSDWRLPTIKELYSLIDFRGRDPSGYNGSDLSGLTPFIDTRAFAFAYGDTVGGERIIDAQFASSTLYVATGTERLLFGVNFADGRIKGYGLTLFGADKTFFVLCVRGNTGYGRNDLVDNGDGTITDRATGLMWAQDDNGIGLTWKEALAWVQAQNAAHYLGHNDWRLPNAKELQSIVDYTRSPDTTGSAAIDPSFRTSTVVNEAGQTDYPCYWTSTTHANWTEMPGAAAVYVAFGRAMGYMNGSWRDVHGAGAQRSDPKTGDPADFPYGRGPQGDAIRIYDYVRCVRGGSGSPASGGQPGNNGGQPDKNPPDANGAAYNIEQAISDKAQGMTIAFDALAFLTGNLGADSFFPPGKVADFWGFQYLRDNDPSQMGHAGDFLTRAAMNMLNVLTAKQRAQLVALAESQVDSINEYAYKRFVLMKAFRRLLEGDVPAGTTGLDAEAVKAYSAQLYRLDGEISYARAQLMGSLISAMDAPQLAYLDSMVGKGMLEWPDVEEPSDVRGLDRDVKVAVMTYAADMFSWYAGSVEADVYFCPERQGTYFGSFYLKDARAMGDPTYAIPTNLTGDMGDALLATMTSDQAQQITGVVDIQRPYLLAIVDAREEVSQELRKFRAGGVADSNSVLRLMEHYGELDGAIIYQLATAFVDVNQTLTSDQRTRLLALRQEMLGDLMYPSGAYLYSQAIDMPEIPNTDFLFGVSAPEVNRTSFVLRSPAVVDGGQLPTEYTGDGTSATLPLEWSGAPEGAESYALIMHHIDPGGIAKWYWILYHIPADVQNLPKNVTGVGILGNNSVNGRTEYAPPHSQGPGPKTYIYTLYALSAPLELAVTPDNVSRDVLLAAMKDYILASAELKVVYARSGDNGKAEL